MSSSEEFDDNYCFTNLVECEAKNIMMFQEELEKSGASTQLIDCVEEI